MLIVCCLVFKSKLLRDPKFEVTCQYQILRLLPLPCGNRGNSPSRCSYHNHMLTTKEDSVYGNITICPITRSVIRSFPRKQERLRVSVTTGFVTKSVPIQLHPPQACNCLPTYSWFHSIRR